MHAPAHKHRDIVMGALVGQAALATRFAARMLYDAGGRDLLPRGVQAALQTVLTRSATEAVTATTPAWLWSEAAARAAAHLVEATVVPTVKAARAHIVRTAARASLVGLVIDAAFGAAEGFAAYRRGTMTRKQACVHTAIEAGTGAVSTAIGVLAAAGAVALTGNMAAPAVMVIGTGAALLAKVGLRRLVARVSSFAPLVAAPA